MQQLEYSPPTSHPPAGADPATASPWYLISPGIWELHLNSDAQKTTKSALQWYEPHAANDIPKGEVCVHSFIEECVIIDGALEDVSMKQAFGMGSYCYRFPGMKHGPYRAGSEGCLQFVKTMQPEVAKP